MKKRKKKKRKHASVLARQGQQTEGKERKHTAGLFAGVLLGVEDADIFLLAGVLAMLQGEETAETEAEAEEEEEEEEEEKSVLLLAPPPAFFWLPLRCQRGTTPRGTMEPPAKELNSSTFTSSFPKKLIVFLHTTRTDRHTRFSLALRFSAGGWGGRKPWHFLPSISLH